MLLTSPGVVDRYIFLKNIWNTLLDSYQQWVYNNTLATVKCHIQQAENSTPAVVISAEEARVDNAILLHYLSSEVALEEPDIRSTDPNIPIDNNCTDDKLHVRMAGGRGDFEDEGDESNAILTASQRRRAPTELTTCDLGTSVVDMYEGEDGDDAEAGEEEEALQADDGSTQNVEY
jgi:hypothetical protein